MTVSTSSGEPQWQEALLAIGRGLDELDDVLGEDDWSTPPVLRPITVDHPLPAHLVPTAQALVSRLAALERRLVDELAQTRSALDDIDVRRSAARNYHQSAAFTSARGSRDD